MSEEEEDDELDDYISSQDPEIWVDDLKRMFDSIEEEETISGKEAADMFSNTFDIMMAMIVQLRISSERINILERAIKNLNGVEELTAQLTAGLNKPTEVRPDMYM